MTDVPVRRLVVLKVRFPVANRGGIARGVANLPRLVHPF